MISIRRSFASPLQTSFITRGVRHARGRGWYKKYQEEGEEGFKRAKSPTPFDWENDGLSKLIDRSKRSQAFFNITIDGEAAGQIKFELADDILPRTCENFKMLCTNSPETAFSYKGTAIHKIVKGTGIMGGDVENLNGRGSHSAFGERHFADEGFVIPHTAPGLLTMATAGVHQNGSLFYVTTAPAPHLDGRSVAFGRVVEGA
eukprot:CAMPEP_0194715702 /NCGR_PEP_ID=MMETSP0296-20130528/7465_1 /TAXON_ID=39354 /ORGANISM="Heterosigma akashiwo, Strain CCMP2393" /LENGTH=202 /DNA_ID=CAMNT_0039615713 /DNA_START=87 /DNA_END=692 /DNA_ORIENTATION=-